MAPHPTLGKLAEFLGRPPASFVQTIIALHCIISSLRLGLTVRSSKDRLIPLVYLLYHGSMETITVELHLISKSTL